MCIHDDGFEGAGELLADAIDVESEEFTSTSGASRQRGRVLDVGQSCEADDGDSPRRGRRDIRSERKKSADHEDRSAVGELKGCDHIDSGLAALTAIEDQDLIIGAICARRSDSPPFQSWRIRHVEGRHVGDGKCGAVLDSSIELAALIETMELPDRQVRHGHDCAEAHEVEEHELRSQQEAKHDSVKVSALCHARDVSQSEGLPDFTIPHRDKIEWMIETNGWALESVAADYTCEPPSAGYCYTVGVAQRWECADIVVFGLTPVASKGLLELVLEHVANGAHIPRGVPLSGLLDNELRCFFADVDTAVHGGKFATAQSWYRSTDFSMMQLLWPDRQGWLPFESGFDANLSLAQPVIGSFDVTES